MKTDGLQRIRDIITTASEFEGELAQVDTAHPNPASQKADLPRAIPGSMPLALRQRGRVEVVGIKFRRAVESRRPGCQSLFVDGAARVRP